MRLFKRVPVQINHENPVDKESEEGVFDLNRIILLVDIIVTVFGSIFDSQFFNFMKET